MKRLYPDNKIYLSELTYGNDDNINVLKSFRKRKGCFNIEHTPDGELWYLSSNGKKYYSEHNKSYLIKVHDDVIKKWKIMKDKIPFFNQLTELIERFMKYLIVIFVFTGLLSCTGNKGDNKYFYIEQAKDGEIVHMKRDCANHVEFYGIRELFGYDFLCGKCVTDDDYRFIERCIERNTNIFKKRSELWEVLNRLGETDCSNARQFYLKMEKALYRRDVYKTLEELGYDVGNWVEDEGFMTEFEKYKRIRTE